MRILVLRTYPNILNTSNYNIQEIGLAKALVRKGHTCDIALYHGKFRDVIERVEVKGSKDGIKIYWLKGINFFKNGIMFSVNQIINNYDVLQVHEYDQILSWYLYSYSRIPVVIYHGPYYDSFNTRYNMKCTIFNKTFLCWHFNRNVPCITKSKLAEKYLNEIGFRNVTTIGVGLDEEQLYKSTKYKNEIDISEEKTILLYVGKIEERRNCLFLLQIFEQLLKIDIEFQLVVVGKGEGKYYSDFLLSAANGIETGNIKLYPEIKQSELGEVYKRCDIFLFPSKYDIFGMVLLEASYYGLSIISSLNGGASTIIKNEIDGKIIETFDVYEWIMEIIQRKINLERRRRTYNKNAVLWDGLADEFLKVYGNAITTWRKK